MLRLSKALLAILITAQWSAAAHAHQANEPRSREHEKHWKARHELLNQRAAAMGANARILFIGDSIIEGFEGPGKAVWDRYYAPRRALNLAIGGDQTQHVLWRLDHGNVDGLKPKLIVLCIGSNNVSWAGEASSTLGQIAEGVRDVVGKLRTKMPEAKILLVGILPSAENPSRIRGDSLQINQIIRRMADGKIVHHVIDDNGMIPTASWKTLRI